LQYKTRSTPDIVLFVHWREAPCQASHNIVTK